MVMMIQGIEEKEYGVSFCADVTSRCMIVNP